jgi:Holliday junction resolvase
MPVKRNIKESLIEAELVTRITLAGGVCEKVAGVGSRGYFDRVVALPGGIVVFVECKRPKGGRVSPHQKRRHVIYKNLGATVAIIRRSSDIDALLAQLEAAKNKGPNAGRRSGPSS